MFFNSAIKKFCYMDCDCYSFLRTFEIKDYDPSDQIEDLESSSGSGTVPPPIVLDEIKNSIKKALVEAYPEEQKEG